MASFRINGYLIGKKPSLAMQHALLDVNVQEVKRLWENDSEDFDYDAENDDAEGKDYVMIERILNMITVVIIHGDKTVKRLTGLKNLLMFFKSKCDLWTESLLSYHFFEIEYILDNELKTLKKKQIRERYLLIHANDPINRTVESRIHRLPEDVVRFSGEFLGGRRTMRRRRIFHRSARCPGRNHRSVRCPGRSTKKSKLRI